MHQRNLFVLTVIASAAASAHANWWGEANAAELAESGAYGCMHCKLLAIDALREGAADARVEPGTGRDLRNFAPDRPADINHMRLDFNIPDMNTPKLTAKQTLSFAAIARPLAMLPLHAEQMEIQSVSIPDSSPLAGTHKVSHAYDGSMLNITFDPPLPPGQEAVINIQYALNDPPDGLTWTPETPEWSGRPAQIHTQGQPATNRYWFPSHDFPNERFTTEIVATVPEGFLVSANGREAEKPRTSGGKSTFHWLQDKDHVGYLVSMVIGKFDVKDVAPAGSTIPMPVYVPPGQGSLIEGTYKRTPDMVKVFEQRFDEPYPWDRYAQLVVWNFGAGGMENTSATTMYDTAILSEKALEDDDLDGLISHELGHQWFGDLITCNTWAHIWLNEGWATYCTGLWYEARDGDQNGYVRYMHGVMRGIADNDQLGEKDSRPGMVSSIYKHPWEVFRRVSNPYPKGASIIHMLRRRLGDDLFFKAVATYVERFKHKTAETTDFRKVFEEVSGQSLEQFFDQWTARPGTPDLKVKAEWQASKKQLVITIEQKQRIDADNPAFIFDLPVEVYTDSAPGAAPVKVTIPVDGKRHERAIDLTTEPALVLIDPDLFVLAKMSVDMPRPWLINQLRTSRSIASRLDASRQLQDKNKDDVRAALAKRLTDPDHHTVRAAAARALGEMSAADELLSALDAGIAEPKVRVAALRALGAAGGTKAIERLARHAADENESYTCRAAALEWLGKRAPRNDTTYLPVFEAALKAESQHDQVRRGALAGLSALGMKEGIAIARPFTQFGTMGRTRPDAINAVARLGKNDKDAAIAIIEPLTTDREDRARNAAIDALVELEDRRGLEILTRAATSTRNPDTKERAETARGKLAARLSKSDGIDNAEAEIERLKADLKRLERQVGDRKPAEEKPSDTK